MTEFTKMSFIVADQHVMTIKRLLTAYRVRDLEDQPMANAQEVDGEITAMTSGDVVELFRDWLKKTRKKEIRSNDIREFQRSVGRSPVGYSYTLRMAQDAGVIRRIKGTLGQSAAYTVRHTKLSKIPMPKKKTSKAKPESKTETTS